jgi:N-acetyl-gamma-glutamyl-phosphate reductase
MRVQIMLPANLPSRTGSAKAMWEALAAHYYKEPFIEVEPLTDASETDETSFDPQEFNDTNRISLRILPHQSGHVILMARLDNLGKGAAGVAIQNLNLMLGVLEGTGLPH